MPVPFADDVRQFVESTGWTFAKTYAGTWPHEYVVRTPENAPKILAVARHIFEYRCGGSVLLADPQVPPRRWEGLLVHG